MQLIAYLIVQVSSGTINWQLIVGQLCSSHLRAKSQFIDRGEEHIHTKSSTDGAETLQMFPEHQLKPR